MLRFARLLPLLRPERNGKRLSACSSICCCGRAVSSKSIALMTSCLCNSSAFCLSSMECDILEPFIKIVFYLSGKLFNFKVLIFLKIWFHKLFSGILMRTLNIWFASDAVMWKQFSIVKDAQNQYSTCRFVTYVRFKISDERDANHGPAVYIVSRLTQELTSQYLPWRGHRQLVIVLLSRRSLVFYTLPKHRRKLLWQVKKKHIIK